jgi:hypothetical protein
MQSRDVTNGRISIDQPIAEEHRQILEKIDQILDPEILICAHEYLKTIPKVIEVVSEQIEDLLKGHPNLEPTVSLINFAKRIIAFIKENDYSDNSILLLKSYLESELANKHQIKSKINGELLIFNQEIFQEQNFCNYNILLKSALDTVIDVEDTRANLKKQLLQLVFANKKAKSIESVILSTATLPNFRKDFLNNNDLEALSRGIFEIGKKHQNLTLSALYFCAFGKLEKCFANNFQKQLAKELIEHVTYERWADFCDLIPLLYLNTKDGKIEIDENTLEDLKEVLTRLEYKPNAKQRFDFKLVFQLARELFSSEETTMILILNNYFKHTILKDQTFDPKQFSELINILEEFPREAVLHLLKEQSFKHSYLNKIRTWLTDCRTESVNESEKLNFYQDLIQLYQLGYGPDLNLSHLSRNLTIAEIPISILENEAKFYKVKNSYLNDLNFALGKGIFSREFIELLTPDALVLKLRQKVNPTASRTINLAQILTDFRDKFSILKSKPEIYDKIILAENLIMLGPEISALGVSAKLFYEQAWTEVLQLISH